MTVVRSILVLVMLVAMFATGAFGNALTVGAGRSEFQHLRWNRPVVRIALSNSFLRPNSNIKADSDVLGALRHSLQVWSSVANVELQFEVSDKQSVSSAGVAGDGVSLITIAQTPDNVLFFANDAETVSAKTRIFYNRRGFITEADIVLNPFQQFSTDGTYGTFDLESTLTHEIGHLLGLRHSVVMGATMAESFARNGTRGIIDMGPRTLADSDIAAVRDLYGAREGDTDCCASVSGKLAGPARTLPALRVWAEDAGSGRVIAQAETAADGTYRLGGLLAGDYNLYWKGQDSPVQNAFGRFGEVSVATGENAVYNAKLTLASSDLSLQYLGLNGRLADFSIPVSGGRSYTLNVGGKGLGLAHVDFSSPFISALSLPPVSQEFGEGVQGLTYFVSVDRDIPAGQYTIALTDEYGNRTCMIGGLNVE
jgi:hypothetical protein